MVKLRHVGITVHDIDKALELYRDIFRLEVVWDKVESGTFIERLTAVDKMEVRTIKLRDTDGGIIELLHCPKHSTSLEENKINKITHIGCSHIALTVEEIDTLYAKLVEWGLKFNYTPQLSEDGKAKVAFCRDYDGTLIELVEVLN